MRTRLGLRMRLPPERAGGHDDPGRAPDGDDRNVLAREMYRAGPEGGLEARGEVGEREDLADLHERVRQLVGGDEDAGDEGQEDRAAGRDPRGRQGRRGESL